MTEVLYTSVWYTIIVQYVQYTWYLTWYGTLSAGSNGFSYGTPSFRVQTVQSKLFK